MEKLTLEEPQDKKATLSDKMKGGISSLFSIFKKKDNNIKFKTSEEALGEIFKLMVEKENDRKLEQQEEQARLKDKNNNNEKRNQELIKALKGLAKPKRKPKKVVEKKKKEVKPEEKKVEPPKKEEPVKPAETKPTPKTEPAKTAETKPAPKAEPAKPAEVKPEPKVEPIKPAAEAPRPRVRAISEPIKEGAKVTATKIGGVAALGAAGISIAGETSAKTVDEAMKKGGQIVPNDPEPGSYSYGIFGMNSKAKTVDNFVKQYPELGITGKSGTKEFNDLWTKVANEKPKQLFDAQMDWYNKSVLAPIRKDLKTVLPENIASDERTVAYFADRRIQYGKTMEGAALKSASGSKTTEEFIDRITKFDLDNIGTAFKTYLSDPRHKGHEVGLAKRIQRRKELALQIENTSGSKVENISKENQQLNMQAEMDANKAKTTVNNIQTNVTSPQKQLPQQDKVDDRPAILKKGQ